VSEVSIAAPGVPSGGLWAFGFKTGTSTRTTSLTAKILKFSGRGSDDRSASEQFGYAELGKIEVIDPARKIEYDNKSRDINVNMEF
jgi:hypothetical protein